MAPLEATFTLRLAQWVSVADSNWGWRIEWACRTAFSTAIISFLALYGPTYQWLSFHEGLPAGPPFAAFATIWVSDVTFDKTLQNALACLLIGSLTTFLAWAVLLAAGESFNNGIALSTLFLFVFLLEIPEFNKMGAKTGISLLALNLVVGEPVPSYRPWQWLAQVAVGCLCALPGTLLPWPRLASTEAYHRASYSSRALSTLLRCTLLAWEHTPNLGCGPTEVTPLDPWYSVLPSHSMDTGFVPLPKEMRTELAAFLENNLALIQERAQEARVNPLLFQTFDIGRYTRLVR